MVNIRTTSKRRAGSVRLLRRWQRSESVFQHASTARPSAPRRVDDGGRHRVHHQQRRGIITNNHVVEGATKIEVGFFGDEPDEVYLAKVVGRDQLTDTALIQLTEKPARPLPEARLGDSTQVQPGDWVMAIGNPFNFNFTVSVGVISGLGRPLQVAEQRTEDVFQTDAAINPGNSGGPLLNLRGEVIAINTAIYTDGARSANIGIGFAVPINAMRDILPQLQKGKVVRGRIGVTVGDISRDALDEFGLKERKGALVSSVLPNSPAGKAGLEPGDVILEFNGKSVKNRNALVAIVMATSPGGHRAGARPSRQSRKELVGDGRRTEP